MLKTTTRDGLVIHTSGDPAQITRAVVERGGEFYLVDTVEETYTESEGAAYDPEQFLETVVDYFRQGRGRRVDSVGEGFGE